ncbi:hypothetical protein Pla52n_03520 [Stieleria varia]|uniref:Uncharacterized protein n=1 Tax=Stieleria varia TaxID=2528005 RepID=A0A5C6B720_9BACT|nr:hypothetical protein Pla52n_03520 [Stieleria varia]
MIQSRNACRNRAQTEGFVFSCRLNECSGSRLRYVPLRRESTPTRLVKFEVCNYGLTVGRNHAYVQCRDVLVPKAIGIANGHGFAAE